MGKRIAYIGIKGLPAKAGADRVVEAIVRGMDKQQYQPTVYCSNRAVPKGTRLPGIKLLRMPTLPGKHLHAASLFLFSALHALGLGQYDLVHVHNVEACFVLPILRMRYKTLATSHGRAQERHKWGRIVRMLIGLSEYPYIYSSDCRTSVAQPLTSYYEERYGQRVHYLPNGVGENIKTDCQGAAAILAEHGLEANGYIMFAAGRIIPTKGCHLLLEAFSDLDSDVRCLIVGDTSHVPSYEQELRRRSGARVHFHSFIPFEEVLYGLIRLARVFVFPSMVEAMSIMLLEAASVGAPILSSDIEENVSVLPDKALRFRSGDAKDLKTQLKWGLEHPDEMAELAAEAKKWVAEQFDWEGIVQDYLRLYESLVR